MCPVHLVSLSAVTIHMKCSSTYIEWPYKTSLFVACCLLYQAVVDFNSYAVTIAAHATCSA